MWYAAPYAQPYLPGAGLPSNPEPELSEESDDEWKLESVKCRNSNGSLEDCQEGSGDDSDNSDVIIAPERLPPDHLENTHGKDDDDYNVPAQRRRRHHSDPHKFIRSIYSQRSWA